MKRFSNTKRLLRVGLLVGCSFISSCEDKKKVVVSSAVSEGTSEAVTDNRGLIEHIFDGTKSDELKAFKVTADVYEAPALALGESYLSVAQLEKKSAKPIAKLINLVNSGEAAELISKEDKCSFKTDMILGENGQMVDLQVSLSLNEFELSFATLLKFTYPAFYEVNVVGKPDKVHVLVLNVYKKSKK